MTGVIFDETAQHAGKAMLHAIVIGVADYGFLPAPGSAVVPPGTFGLQKLTAAARSAVDVAVWLQVMKDQLMAPVGTIRLCVAPAVADQTAPGAPVPVPGGAAGATRDEVVAALKAWRGQLKPDDVSLFYFAGHGVQRDRSDMVLLCADFANPADGPLSCAVDFTHVWDGLGRNLTSATIARTQLYFVDACRERPAAFSKFEEMSVPDVWGVPQLQGKDDRRAPIYYATTAGALAYADPGAQTLFSRTILSCLEREAATLDDDTGDWQITSRSLNEALGNRFRALAGVATDQECDSEHVVGDFLIRRLTAPPMCALTFQIEPDAAVADPAAVVSSSGLHIRDTTADHDTIVPAPLQPHPYQHSLAAGFYKFRATPVPPLTSVPRPVLVDPSRISGPIKLKVGP
jgi:hypothetical protein